MAEEGAVLVGTGVGVEGQYSGNNIYRPFGMAEVHGAGYLHPVARAEAECSVGEAGAAGHRGAADNSTVVSIAGDVVSHGKCVGKVPMSFEVVKALCLAGKS